ncbi:hypothetical protein K2X33_05195 [bacterium]|nr:hypothetical protein [bacterium]
MKKTSNQKKKSSVLIDSVTGAREFFASELQSVMRKQQVEAQQDSFNYLVGLLVSSIDSNTFFAQSPEGKPADHYLVSLYAEYLEGTPEVKRRALRRLGDVCLMVSGFFPDSLNRKLVDVDYYSGMGGAAYWQLAQAGAETELFKELSVKFRPFSEVLSEMSSRSGLQNNQDVLRLYERWLHTGSDRLKALLAEKGIGVPFRTDVKSKH